eukprot:scaffold54219_cov48-Phaeocystis_antarctica.AAC.3
MVGQQRQRSGVRGVSWEAGGRGSKLTETAAACFLAIGRVRTTTGRGHNTSKQRDRQTNWRPDRANKPPSFQLGVEPVCMLNKDLHHCQLSKRQEQEQEQGVRKRTSNQLLPSLEKMRSYLGFPGDRTAGDRMGDCKSA